MLLIDTCGSTGGVAIAELPRVATDASPRLAALRVLPGRATQERLMTALAEVLRENDLRAAELDVLTVVTGPGSFTGVRIGLAAVKGLAESLEKPVVAISRLAVLAAQGGKSSIVQAWMDAGRGDVFVGRYRQGECLSEVMMHGADAIANVSDAEPVLAMEGLTAGLHPAIQYVPEHDLHAVLPLAVHAVQAGTFADVALLDANYLRVPDAELHRRAAAERQDTAHA